MPQMCTATRVGAAALFTCLYGAAVGAQGQTPPSPVGPGERVRITFESRRVDGVLTVLNEQTLTLQPRDGTAEITVSRAAITKLERTFGHRSRARGAGLGALSGLGLGAAAGLASSTACKPTDWFCSAGFNAGLFGIFGAGLGAITGVILPPATRWVEVDPSALTDIAQSRPPLDAPRVHRWATAIGTGATWGGPAADLEAAMRTNGFADTSPAFLFPASPHPHSTGELGSVWFDADYSVRPPWGVGLSYDKTKMGSTVGFHNPSQYLVVHDVVTSVAALASRAFGPAQLGAGPAWYSARTYEEQTATLTRHSRLGVIMQAGLRLPAHTTMYLDVSLQYRYVGQETVGPFTPAPQQQVIRAPETDVRFNHWFLGVGPGLRF